APTLEATPLEPLLAVAGDSVLIDCVVKNLQNYTIIWRRVVPGSNKTEILSAGEVRIIPDPRFSLLHQKDHETWVLQIQKAQVNDSGRYVCEVNTSPRMQIYRLLSVVERIPSNSKAFPVDHNYTDRINQDPTCSSGGTAILIKKHLTHHEIPNPTLNEIEATTISLNLPNIDPIIISSIYIPPSSKTSTFTLDLKSILQLGNTCILGGDFNAHHVSWGSNKNTEKGNKIKSLANSANLDIIAPSTPTRYGNYTASFIDFIMAKNFLYPYDISSVPELSSDHNPVIANFYFNYKAPKQNNTFKTNWKNFKSDMINSTYNFNQITNSNELDSEISNFTENINKIFNSNSKIVDPTTQYINNKIKTIHHERNVARRNWQSTRNPAFKTLFNRLHRQATKLEQKIKQDDWRDKLIALQPNDNSLWNTAKQMRKQHTKISALKGQSSIALSNSEKAETLADSLENQFTLNNLKDPDTENIVHNTILKFFNSPTDTNITPPTFSELLHHTNKINVRKAPGIDGISNKIIRNLPLTTILKFYHLLTHIFKLNHFPTSWKTAVVIPILKPGKDPTAPASYRPISLLPNFSKITEHFILQRLNEHFYSNNILIPFQFGFKPKLSTTHQLLRATETISAGFENKEHTGAVFLDIQKAFDRVWLNGLIYKLIN
ncbi:RNA-directed DNA polymerase from mobile element jockey, partial [Araneus ventricosus]